MININIEQKFIGKLSAEVLKKCPVTGELVPSLGQNKRSDCTNIITNYGIQSISKDLSPKFPNHYLVVGTGVQPNKTDLGITKLQNRQIVSSNLTQSTSQKVPNNTFTNPILVTNTVTFQFQPSGVNRNYSEIGIADSNNATNYNMYTYTTFKDTSGNDTAVTVEEDEYLKITYSYQTQYMRHYPVDVLVGVSGDNPMNNLYQSLYRKTQGTSGTHNKAILYYSSEEDYNDSGWINNFDSFHRNDQGLLDPEVGGDGTLSGTTGFFGTSGLTTSTQQYINLVKKPIAKQIPQSTFGGSLQNTTFSPNILNSSESPIYIVQMGQRTMDFIFMFNKPIPVTMYDKMSISVSVTKSNAEATWIDPSTYS